MSPQRLINLTFLFCAGLVAAFFALAFWQSASPTRVEANAQSPNPSQLAAITRLTHDAGSAFRPAWSPDNRLISYESHRDNSSRIYVMNADGTQPRAMTPDAINARHPSWVPDGTAILFDSNDGVHQDIWRVNLADGALKQLTHADGFAEHAAMTPDGARIAYYIYQDMTLNLWTARADGSDAQPLTRDFADARRKEPTMAWRTPAWSPDSQFIAYTGADGRSIWLMRANGSDAHAVISDDETNHLPFFLKDGRLAFITEYVPPKYGAAWTNLSAYDLKTGKRVLLQEFMSMQEPFAWNVDLTRLVFASPRNGNFDIYLIDVNAPGGVKALRGDLNISAISTDMSR